MSLRWRSFWNRRDAEEDTSPVLTDSVVVVQRRWRSSRLRKEAAIKITRAVHDFLLKQRRLEAQRVVHSLLENHDHGIDQVEDASTTVGSQGSKQRIGKDKQGKSRWPEAVVAACTVLVLASLAQSMSERCLTIEAQKNITTMHALPANRSLRPRQDAMR